MKRLHYIEIKVRRWKLLPKVRLGFLFDMYAWFMLFDEFGVDIEQLKGSGAKNILYAAAVSAAKEKGRNVWFTTEDIERFIENATTKESNQVIKTLRDSQTVVQEFSEKMKTGTEPKKK